MQKSVLILTLSLALTSARVCFGATGDMNAGIFGSGIILTGSGVGAANPGVETLYALDMGDNADLPPSYDTAIPVSTQQAGGTASTPTFNLGTFLTSDTLVLNGGSLLTYSNGGTSQVAGAQLLNYNVFGGGFGTGFMTLSLPADGSPGGVAGNTRFDTESAGVNLLSGLALGTYTLDIYNSSGVTGDPSGATTFFDSNGGGDYGFSFSIVPEPGAMSLLLVALGSLVLIKGFSGRAKLS